MKFVHSTPTSPAVLKFGRVLEVNLYKHMICWEWFEHFEVSFAWWAYGESFVVFEFILLESFDDMITLLHLKIGKTSLAFIHNN